MSKSNELEKSKGVVLFAFNSEKVNYVKIADLTSKLINQNLKLPITLITDEESVPKFDYDRIITFTPKTGNYRKDKKNNLKNNVFSQLAKEVIFDIVEELLKT